MLERIRCEVCGFISTSNRFFGDENGGTAIEYGFIALGVALAIAAAINLLGNAVSALFLSLWPVGGV